MWGNFEHHIRVLWGDSEHLFLLGQKLQICQDTCENDLVPTSELKNTNLT